MVQPAGSETGQVTTDGIVTVTERNFWSTFIGDLGQSLEHSLFSDLDDDDDDDTHVNHDVTTTGADAPRN